MVKETIELEVSEELGERIGALLVRLINLGLDAAERDERAKDEAKSA